MLHRLVRITSNDYREYRRAYTRIEYSFFEKGKAVPFNSDEMKEMMKEGIKGKGLGTILYNEVLNIIKQHKCKRIELWCPFVGAQIFWRKKGFSLKTKDGFFGKRV